MQNSKNFGTGKKVAKQVHCSQIIERMHRGGSRIYERAHWKRLNKKIMEITLLGRVSLSYFNLVHKSILTLQAMKIPDAEAAVDRVGTARKIAGMADYQSQEQKGVIQVAQKEGRTIHFAELMDICHLKNSELEPKFQKYKGRAVLGGDIVKKDSGYHAVFTEQGSSASQMTAGKVMKVFARLPGSTGQAADAVSAHTKGRTLRIIETLSRYLDTLLHACQKFALKPF